MPEVFLEFLGNSMPWVFLLLIPLYFWGKLNHAALTAHSTHPDSFERVIGWLRENNLGLFYLVVLGWLIDRAGDFIGDRQKLNQIYGTSVQSKGFIRKTFGLNPFTPESYDKCLHLAFLYPVLSFFITWALGGSGQIGNMDFFVQITEEEISLPGWQRWLLLSTMLLLIGWSLWFVYGWSGWGQWIALNILLLLFGILIILFSWKYQIVANIWDRWDLGWLIFLSLFIPMYLSGWLVGWLVYRSVKKANESIYDVSFAFSVTVTFSVVVVIFGFVIFEEFNDNFIVLFEPAFSVAFDGIFTVAFVVVAVLVGAFAFIIAAAVAVGFYIDGSFVFESIVCGCSVGIVLTVLGILKSWLAQHSRLAWFWLAYSVLFFLLGYVILYLSRDSSDMAFLLFWLLFPLANAPMDWLSLGVTRGLLQAMRIGKHSGWAVLVWTLVDLVLALLFLFLITAMLVSVTALGNAVANTTLVDIEGILQGLQFDPISIDHWWIYFMLLSTLVPTLLHFALAGGAVTLWLPRKWRLQLADGLERDVHKTFLAWAYMTFMPVIGFVLVPGALLYFLWWLVNVNSAWLGKNLLLWAEMLAHFANPAMQ